MFLEVSATIILLIGLIGMAVIIIRKMPVLAEFSLEQAQGPGFFSKIRKKGGFLAKKGAFKTKTKAKDYIAKHRSKGNKDKFSDDFWSKVRRGK